MVEEKKMEGGGCDNDWLKKGAVVEVCFDEEGFRGSWYSATVLRRPCFKYCNNKEKKVLLEFHNLLSHRNPKQPHRQYVDLILVRPIPPMAEDPCFHVSDEVDAFHNDGWWEGVVMAVLPSSPTGYSVFFRCSREQIDFPGSLLRLHREWIYGKWVPNPNSAPAEDASVTTTTTFSLVPSSSPTSSDDDDDS